MKKKHMLCVIGAGKWGLNHVNTLYKLGSLGGIVDKENSVTKKIKSLYPDCYTFSCLDDALKADFDAYVISTPPSTHYELAVKIINARKPVLIEKPITLNLKDAKKLNSLAKLKKVNLMVGHLLLFHPAFKKIKKLITDGTLGEIQYIYSNRLNLGNFRNNENVLWSFAPHDISLFNYYFNDSPLEVSSSGVDILQEGIHDTSITSFKYSNNKMGHIFVSWLHPFKEHRFVIIGSKGMIHFEAAGKNKPLIFYDKTIDLKGDIPRSRLGNSYEINYKNNLPLEEELKYFISKIDNGNIKIANGDSAVAVMDILERATESLIGKG
tara:strand:+ start:670 stop:1641 length:972 start_codon:yes stop_codon:yes gene_type:complete